MKNSHKCEKAIINFSQVTYKNEPVIQLRQDRLDEMNDVQKKDFVNSCPSKVYKFDETSKKVIADIEDLAVFNCTFCQGI